MWNPGLTAAALLVLPAAGAAQDRHRLEVRAREGDRFTHHQEQTHKISLKITMKGRNDFK